MRNDFFRDWLLPLSIGGIIGILLFSTIGQQTTGKEMRRIQQEIQELRTELKAHREFIGRLQEESDYANAKADWLLKKIDKRRILIPVLGGKAYKIVEIDDAKFRESTDEHQQD